MFEKEPCFQLLKQWIDYKKAAEGRSDSTAEKYFGYLVRLKNFYPDTPFIDLSYQELLDWTGMHLYKEGLSPSSRKAVIAAVKGFYTWLFENGHIPSNPSLRLVYPRIGRKIPKALGLKNAEKLLMAPDINTFIGLRDVTIMAMLIGTGMRISGLISLNQESLVWYEDEAGHSRCAVSLEEKGKNQRVVPVPSEAMLLLQAYLAHPDFRSADRLLPNGQRVLFINTRNRTVPEYDHRGEKRRLQKRTVQDIITKHAKAAGIPADQAHPHAMRHLVGAELAEESATTPEVMTLLGHANADTTRIYQQLALRKLTQVVDKANPLGKINTHVTPLTKMLK